MRALLTLLVAAATFATAVPTLADHHEQAGEGWVELFNGKDLTGWKVSENPDSIYVENNVIVTHGDRAHAFYVGDVGGADFKNFELKLEVLTKPNSNSGVFFHTAYQEEGWPAQGYEVQVNQTHHDRIKTGSIYAVENVMDDSPAEDEKWFTLHFSVQGKQVVVKVDGEVVNEYTEPDDLEPPADRPNRRLSHGTIALQGHDPVSEVHYRSVKIKLLD